MSNATVELAERSRRMISERRSKRWIIGVGIALAVSAVLWTADGYRRKLRSDRWEAALKSARAYVKRRESPVSMLVTRLRGGLPEIETTVGLDHTAIDGEWLQQHDQLCDLQITTLRLSGHHAINGADLAELMAKHPLRHLMAARLTHADACAASINTLPTLTYLNLSGSDLTDIGFRTLPLEQFEVLKLAGTAVTPTALQELRRCRQLQELSLDGTQFDIAVSELLRDKSGLQHFTLRGESVTDEHLRRLHGMKLKSFEVQDTSITTEGIEALRAAQPDCTIEVY